MICSVSRTRSIILRPIPGRCTLNQPGFIGGYHTLSGMLRCGPLLSMGGSQHGLTKLAQGPVSEDHSVTFMPRTPVDTSRAVEACVPATRRRILVVAAVRTGNRRPAGFTWARVVRCQQITAFVTLIFAVSEPRSCRAGLDTAAVCVSGVPDKRIRLIEIVKGSHEVVQFRVGRLLQCCHSGD